MSEYRKTMRAVAARTAPDSESLARVRGRLDAAVEPTTAILAHLDAPSPFEVERLRRRLHGPRLPERRAWTWPALGGLAVAAAATVLFVSTTREPPTTQLELSSTELASASPSDLLQMDYVGQGRLTGAEPSWVVDWEHGTVGLTVTPNAGADVRVITRDAEVRVVGTMFDVTRDELGTAVSVEHGRVEVTCRIGADAVLTAGQAHLCWPASAAGLLGRALALADKGSPVVERLAVLDAGLGLADPVDPVRDELLAERVQSLVEIGEHRAALTAAETYLGNEDGSRTQDIRHIAAHLALALDGCTQALPHLRALQTPTDDEAARLAACVE
jgi:hypothetical protein